VSTTASEPRTLDVAVYGIINAGKSSLINALAGAQRRPTSPIGGTTTEVAAEAWREVMAEVGPYAVRLIDTPGIAEVADSAHAAIATEAARRADLVLFVLAEDLTATAQSALTTLRDAAKPMLVALNKMDLLDPDEQTAVLAKVRERLAGVVPADDIVPIAAAPIVRERVVEPDGTSRLELRHGPPRIEVLEARLIEGLAESAPDLKDLADAADRIERHLAARAEAQAERRAQAEAVADETASALALTLALNPVPMLDFLAGPGGLVLLVRRVAEVYGATPTVAAATHLAHELLHGGRFLFLGSLAAAGAGGLLKFLPGLGHLAGALTQGAAVGYVAHVFGRALVGYYERGHDWGDAGLVAALDRIAARTDRRALARGLVEKLKRKMDFTAEHTERKTEKRKSQY
jgi:small GTP-binding protein